MSEEEEKLAKIQVVSDHFDADVIIYNGSLDSGDDHTFLKVSVARKNKRKNVLLVLTTPGGEAHSAYRIARYLQNNYQKFSVFVPGWCKSAGTLLAIGAHEIIIGELGQLGPLDVQRGKPDELWETSSGLTEDAALDFLEKTAFKMLGDYLLGIKGISRGQVTFGTAAEVAAKLVVGQLEPIYRQINPAKIGENARAMSIATDYGMRLNLHSQNLSNRKSLNKLVSAYSSHGFVIDEKEARELFINVSKPNSVLEELCEALGDEAYFPIDGDEPLILYANQEQSNEATHPSNETTAEPSHDDGAGSGGAGNAPLDVPDVVVPLHSPGVG
jgi:hypothetical protein